MWFKGSSKTGETINVEVELSVMVEGRQDATVMIDSNTIMRMEFSPHQKVSSSAIVYGDAIPPGSTGTMKALFDAAADNCKPRFCGRKTNETNVLHCQFLGLKEPTPVAIISVSIESIPMQRVSTLTSSNVGKIYLGSCENDEYHAFANFSSSASGYMSVSGGELTTATLTPINNWIGATTVYTVATNLRLGAERFDIVAVQFPSTSNVTTTFYPPVTASQPSTEFAECYTEPAAPTVVRCQLTSVAKRWEPGEYTVFNLSNIVNHLHPYKRPELTPLTLTLYGSDGQAIVDTTSGMTQTVGMIYGRFAEEPIITPLDPYIGWTTTYHVKLRLRHPSAVGYHFGFFIRHRPADLDNDEDLNVSFVPNEVEITTNLTGLLLEPAQDGVEDEYPPNMLVDIPNYGLWSDYGSRPYGSGPFIRIKSGTDPNVLRSDTELHFLIHNVINPHKPRPQLNDLAIVHFGCADPGAPCYESMAAIDWSFHAVSKAIVPAPMQDCKIEVDTDYVTEVTGWTFSFKPATTRVEARFELVFLLPENSVSQTAGRTITVTGIDPLTPDNVPKAQVDSENPRKLRIYYDDPATITKDEIVTVRVTSMKNPSLPQPSSSLTFELRGPLVFEPTEPWITLESSNDIDNPPFIYPPLGASSYERLNSLTAATTTYTVRTQMDPARPLQAGHSFTIEFPWGTNVGIMAVSITSLTSGVSFNSYCAITPQVIKAHEDLPSLRCIVSSVSSPPTNVAFTLTSVVNPPHPGHLPLANLTLRHYDATQTLVAESQVVEIDRTWYGPLGTVVYTPEVLTTGVTTTYSISVTLRHFASPHNEFFIYMPLDGDFAPDLVRAEAIGDTLIAGGEMSSENCRYTPGPPAWVGCEIINEAGMGAGATVTFKLHGVVNPTLAVPPLRTTRLMIVSDGAVIKDLTEYVETPQYVHGQMAALELEPFEPTTGTTTTYIVRITLRLGLADSELIHITFPTGTRFAGVPVATAMSHEGVEFGDCWLTDLRVTCPVESGASAWPSHEQIVFNLTNIINPLHPPRPTSQIIVASITDNGPYYYIKDDIVDGTILETTTGLLGECLLTPHSPITAVTTDYSVMIQLRHFALENWKVRVQFAPFTKFAGTPVGVAEGVTADNGGEIGNCAIVDNSDMSPTVLCDIIQVGSAFSDAARFYFKLSNIINPIEAHEELNDLSAMIFDDGMNLVDKSEAMKAPALEPGTFATSRYVPSPPITFASAVYHLSLTVRQPWAAGDRFQFGFQPDTTFDAGLKAMAEGLTFTECSASGLVVTCDIESIEPGYYAAEGVQATIEIYGVINPPHPPRAERSDVSVVLLGKATSPNSEMRLKDQTLSAIVDYIQPNPLLNLQATVTPNRAAYTAEYEFSFVPTQDVHVGDKIRIRFPPGTTWQNPVMTSPQTGFGSCTGLGTGEGDGLELVCPLVTATLPAGEPCTIVVGGIINSGAHPVLPNAIIVSTYDQDNQARDEGRVDAPAIVPGQLSAAGYQPMDRMTGATTTYTVQFQLQTSLRDEDQFAVLFPTYTSSVGNITIELVKPTAGVAMLGTCEREETFVTCKITNAAGLTASTSVEFILANVVNPDGDHGVLTNVRVATLDPHGQPIDETFEGSAPALEPLKLNELYPDSSTLIPAVAWTGHTTTYDVSVRLRQALLPGDKVQISFAVGTDFTVAPTATSMGDAATTQGITWKLCEPSSPDLTCQVDDILAGSGKTPEDYVLTFQVSDVTNHVHPPRSVIPPLVVRHLNALGHVKDLNEDVYTPPTIVGEISKVIATPSSPIVGQTATYHFEIGLRYPVSNDYEFVIDFPFGTRFVDTDIIAEPFGNSATGGAKFRTCSTDPANKTRLVCPVEDVGGPVDGESVHAFALKHFEMIVHKVINPVDVPPNVLFESFWVRDSNKVVQDEMHTATMPNFQAGTLGDCSIKPQITTTATTTTYDISLQLRQALYPLNTIEVVFPTGTTFDGLPVATTTLSPDATVTFEPECSVSGLSVFCVISSIERLDGDHPLDHDNLPIGTAFQVPTGYVSPNSEFGFNLTRIINTPHPGYPLLNNVTIRIWDHYQMLRDYTDEAEAAALEPGLMLDAEYYPVNPAAAATTDYVFRIHLRHYSLSGYKFEIHFPYDTSFLPAPQIIPLHSMRARLGTMLPCEENVPGHYVTCVVDDPKDSFGPMNVIDFRMTNVINRRGAFEPRDDFVIRHLDQDDVLIDIFSQTRSGRVVPGQLGASTHYMPQNTLVGATTEYSIDIHFRQPILNNDRIEIYFPYLTVFHLTPSVEVLNPAGVTVTDIMTDAALDNYEDPAVLHAAKISFRVSSLSSPVFDAHTIGQFRITNIVNPRYEVLSSDTASSNRRVIIYGEIDAPNEEVIKDWTDSATMDEIRADKLVSTMLQTGSGCYGERSTLTFSFVAPIQLDAGDWIDIQLPVGTSYTRPEYADDPEETVIRVISTSPASLEFTETCEWNHSASTLRCQLKEGISAIAAGASSLTVAGLRNPIAGSDILSPLYVAIYDKSRAHRKLYHDAVPYNALEACAFRAVSLETTSTFPGSTATYTFTLTLPHFASAGDRLKIQFPTDVSQDILSVRSVKLLPRDDQDTIRAVWARGGNFTNNLEAGPDAAMRKNELTLTIERVAPGKIAPPRTSDFAGKEFVDGVPIRFVVTGIINARDVTSIHEDVTFTLLDPQDVVRATSSHAIYPIQPATECPELLPAKHEGSALGVGPVVTYQAYGSNGLRGPLAQVTYHCADGFELAAGASATRECREAGWSDVAPTCVDIDECAMIPSPCDECINTYGGYVCPPRIVSGELTVSANSTDHGTYVEYLMPDTEPGYRVSVVVDQGTDTLQAKPDNRIQPEQRFEYLLFSNDLYSSTCKVVELEDQSGTSFKVTCELEAATGVNLKPVIHFCYSSSLDSTMCATTSTRSYGDVLSYPAPTISPGTIRSFTYPLANNDTTTHVFALSQLGETINFQGFNFVPRTSMCHITYGASQYTCRMLPAQSTTTDITCVTQNYGVGGDHVFTIECGGMSATGTDMYTYPDIPVITSISPSIDLATGGNQSITVEGHNFELPMFVSVDGKRCELDETEVNATTTKFACRTPVSAGLDVPVFISARAKFSTPSEVATVSYAYPVITKIEPKDPGTTGCEQRGDLELINCARTGGEWIRIIGTNFGESRAQVFIGSEPCTDLEHDPVNPHEIVICKTPQGYRPRQTVVLLQYDGELSEEHVRLSYRLCESGTVNSGIDCVACPAGKFSNEEGADVCIDCPAGKFAPVEGSTECTLCAEGKYNPDVGMSACYKCPSGYVQPHEGRQDCIPCPPGWFQSDSAPAQECKPCPKGEYQSLPAQSHCEECPAGRYTDEEGQPDCKPCLAGSYQPDKRQDHCIECSQGKYQDVAAATTCNVCKPGFYANETNQNFCTPCPQGRFQPHPEQSDCIDCDVGMYQDQTGQSSCKACDPGTFTNKTTQKECEPCPQGYYQPQSGQIDCVECPIGTKMPTIGASVCLDCEAGRFAPDLGYKHCLPCPVGYFVSTTGAAQCKPCPVGYHQDEIGRDQCEPCESGKYAAVVGQEHCTPCPQGQYNPDTGKSKCQLCSEGTHMDETGKTACKNCPTGRYTDTEGRHTCVPCQEGKYQAEEGKTVCIDCPFDDKDLGQYQSQPGQAACLLCPEGKYADENGLKECKLCPAGRYTSETGRTVCDECSTGKIQPELGQTQCIDPDEGLYSPSPQRPIALQCPPGFYRQQLGDTSRCEPCAPGYENPYTGKTTCTACVPGRYNTEHGTSQCMLCEPGKFQLDSGKTFCHSCPAGRSNPSYELDQPCSICEAGTFAPFLGMTACLECEAGRWSSVEASACTMCEPGTYQPNSHRDTCEECPEGKFAANPGSTACTDCEEGKISGAGASTCEACERGKYATGLGNSVCLNCTEGYYAESRGLGRCLPCPAGRYQDDVGKSLCLECQPGTYTKTEGESYCQQCVRGRYTSDVGATECLDCPAGSIADSDGAPGCVTCAFGSVQPLAGQSACVDCLPGEYSPIEGGLACLPCPAGMYQDEPRASMCQTCDRGYYTNSTGQKECMACDRGSFNLYPGRTFCEECAPGTFQSQEGAFSPCIKCEAGTYQNEPKATACVECPPGRFSGDEALECQPCQAGKFAENVGSVACDDCPLGTAQGDIGMDFCAPCEPGKYAGMTGMQQCLDCPLGKFSDEDRANRCQDCPIASYQDEEGQTQCKPCAPGRYQDAEGTTICEQCPVGRFQNEEGRSVCENCEAGKYQNLTEQISCILCPNGTYTAAPESDQCTACPGGKYRFNLPLAEFDPTVSGEIAAACEDCPPGKYQPDEGLTYCLDCAEGTFNNGPGQRACIECLPGTYQNETGQEVCPPCPLGKFSDDYNFVNCVDCEPGRYASSTGLTECTDCAPGTYAKDPGMQACDPCEPGRYMGDPRAADCLPCAAGFYNQEPNQLACLPCVEGEITKTPGQVSCEKCPIGFYQPRTGQSFCEECEVGKYSASDGSYECTPCSVGQYQDETGQTECKKCEVGMYRDQEGAFNCTFCEPGRFASLEGMSACDDCRQGFFANVTGKVQCDECEPGKMQDMTGQTACVNCKRGRYTPDQQRGDCTLCERGRYGNRDGLTACIQCAAGRYNERLEQTVCTRCAPGRFSAQEGAKTCDDCQRGRYTDYAGSTDCDLCPIGRYQPDYAQTTCLACPLGKAVNVRGAGVCDDCGNGRYADVTGLDECKECPAGKYAEVGFIQCINCSKGYFSGANAGQCSQCTSGTYAAVEGQELCTKCIDNSESSWDYKTCLCSSGYYLVNGKCEPCPTCGRCTKKGTTQFNIQPAAECYPAMNAAEGDLDLSVKRVRMYVFPGEYSACTTNNDDFAEFIANTYFKEKLLEFDTGTKYDSRIEVIQPVAGEVPEAFVDCPSHMNLTTNPFRYEPSNTNAHATLAPTYQPEIGHAQYFVVDILPAAKGQPTPNDIWNEFLIELNLTNPIDLDNPEYPTQAYYGQVRRRARDKYEAIEFLRASAHDPQHNLSINYIDAEDDSLAFSPAVHLGGEGTHIVDRVLDSKSRQLLQMAGESTYEKVKILTTALSQNEVSIGEFIHVMDSLMEDAKSRQMSSLSADSIFDPFAAQSQPAESIGLVFNGYKVKSRATFDILASNAQLAHIYAVVETNYTRYSTVEFIECLNKACSENGCSEGYEGNLCTHCAKGYGRTTIFECRLCPPLAQNVTLGLAVVFGLILICGFLSYRTILAGAAANRMNDDSQSSGGQYAPPYNVLIKITMTGMQVMSIATQMELEWPGFLGDLMSASDSAVNVTSLVSVDCYITGSTTSLRPFFVQSIFFLILPVIALGFAALIIYPTYRRKHRQYVERLIGEPAEVERLTARHTRIWMGYYVTTATVVSFMLHPNLVRASFLMLACKKLGQANAQTYLLADLSERCYTTTHFVFILVVCLPMMVLYVFGIPLITFTYLYKNRDIVVVDERNLGANARDLIEKKREFGAKMAFVYQGYLPQYYFWFLAEMIRKTLLVAVSVFFIGKLHLQILMASLMVFLCLLAQLAALPFENMLMDWMEFLSLFSAFCLFFLGNFYFVEGIPTDTKVTVTMIIVCDVFLFAFGVVYCFVWMFRNDKVGGVVAYLKMNREMRDVQAFINEMLGTTDKNGRYQKQYTRGLGLPTSLVGVDRERLRVDMIGGALDELKGVDLGEYDHEGRYIGPTRYKRNVVDEFVGRIRDDDDRVNPRHLQGEIEMMAFNDGSQVQHAPVGGEALVPVFADGKPMYVGGQEPEESSSKQGSRRRRGAAEQEQAKFAIPEPERLDPKIFSNVSLDHYEPLEIQTAPEDLAELARVQEEIGRDEIKYQEQNKIVEAYTKRFEEATGQILAAGGGDDEATEDVWVDEETARYILGQTGVQGDQQTASAEDVTVEYYDEFGNPITDPTLLEGDEVVYEYYEE